MHTFFRLGDWILKTVRIIKTTREIFLEIHFACGVVFSMEGIEKWWMILMCIIENTVSVLKIFVSDLFF